MTTAPAAAPLVARTVEVEDTGPLLGLLPDEAVNTWVRRGEGIVGWGSAWSVRTTGPDRIEAAERAWQAALAGCVVRDEVGLAGTGPVAFGSFAFSSSSPTGGVLTVPRVILGRRDGRSWVTTVTATGGLPTPALPRPVPAPRRPTGVTFADGGLHPTRWEAVVAEAVGRIGVGTVDKVVLARDLLARADSPVDLRWLLASLGERYPGCWTFGVDGLVGATPELLVRRSQGLVTSRVLAGTIRRTGDDTADLALAGSLARSSKDLEEHLYAVRSVAESLTPWCRSMNVPETPFVLHLPNVMHLATDVTGVLGEQAVGAGTGTGRQAPSSLALAAALHPSAAVCGTPTAEAAAMIAELEGMDRGRYTGPVGWVDASGDGEWGIALRCAQQDPVDPRQLRLFAGCGIVAGSDPQAELAESDAKLVPIREALLADRVLPSP